MVDSVVGGSIRLQESMLTKVKTTSSACTGSYSGEMGQALIQKTINTSGKMRRPVEFTCIRAHDPCWQKIKSLLQGPHLKVPCLFQADLGHIMQYYKYSSILFLNPSILISCLFHIFAFIPGLFHLRSWTGNAGN